MTVGERVETLRKEKSLTQEQLAEKLECDQVWVSRIETKRRRFEVAELRALASAFAMPLHDFLVGVDVEQSDAEEQAS